MLRQVIWHFSDIHFSVRKPGPGAEMRAETPTSLHYPSQHLKQWCAVLENHIPKLEQLGLLPAWIVCSGDLAHTIQSQELDVALDFLDRTRKLVRLQKRRVVVVPGNHDVELFGRGLAPYYAKVRQYQFASPEAPPLRGEATDGLLPLPIDTNAIVGLSLLEGLNATRLARQVGVPVGDLRKVLKGLEAALPGLRHRAGVVDPPAVTQLLETVSELRRGKGKLRAFPFVVCHHPLATPPTEVADLDPEDTTVLMSTMKQRLYGHGVQLVLQGHRHQAVAHKEGLIFGAGEAANLVAVTAPPLGGDPSRFVMLEVVRSTDGAVRYVTGRMFSLSGFPAELEGAATQRPWFRKTLLDNSTTACRLVRKVVRIEAEGFTRVDYFLHQVPDGLANGGVPIAFRPRGGRVISGPDAFEIGREHGSIAPRVSLEDGPRKPPPGVDLRVLYLKGAKGPVSAVVRATAQGAHALFREEAALLRGRASGDKWDLEVTDVSCGAPTRLLDVIIRFPDKRAVPKDLFFFAVTRECSDPIAEWDKRVEHIRCLDEASFSVWWEGRRVMVQVPQPLPGLIYCLAWRLPSLSATAADRAFSSILSRVAARLFGDPLIGEWPAWAHPEVTKPAAEPGDGAFRTMIYALADELLKCLPGLREAALSSRLDIALFLPSAAYGDSPAAASTIQCVAALGPRGCTPWDRWRHQFRYGTGVVGRSLRTGRSVLWWPDAPPPREAIDRSYVPIADEGPNHAWLCCLPAAPKRGRAAACVLTIGGYRGTEPPEELRSYVRLAGTARELWARANSHLEEARVALELVHEAPQLDTTEPS